MHTDNRSKPKFPTKKSPDNSLYGCDLADLPPELRWREWMRRLEVVLFASSQPVDRTTLARVIGADCSCAQARSDFTRVTLLLYQ
ncbi:hypothetical protein [Pseudochrobactrum sp. MP213Fo]|uniref:hypothetical protein n=1 Tax=Pseudochrobactrum sp. MP213Fo TaxID=3022250 RepID=UPI003BA0A35A